MSKPIVALQPPHADKGYMFSFWGQREVDTMAANTALQRVLNQHKLMPFHQVGVTPEGDHKPGYHAWEIWKPATEEQLTALLSEIDEATHEELADVRAMYAERDFPEMYALADFGDRVDTMMAEHNEKAHAQRGLPDSLERER